jgi:hypothetical protein
MMLCLRKIFWASEQLAVVVEGKEQREESSHVSAAEQAEQARAQAFGSRAVKFLRERSGEMRRIRVRSQL